MKQQHTDITDHSYPLEELLETSAIIFYQCRFEKNLPLTYLSKNVADVLGFTCAEFYNNSSLWTDRIHPDELGKVLTRFDNIVELGSFTVEFRFRHKKGHFIWLKEEVKLIRDNQGNPQSVGGSAIEITGHKETQQELRQLNETLEQRIKKRTRELTTANRKLKLLEIAVANINDMVIITRVPKDKPLDARIVFVNHAFESFTGYRFSEVRNSNPDLLHGELTSQEAVSHINEKIENHEPLRAEFINYKKDGTPYWVELDMAPFPADEPQFEYWVGINRDISQRKQAEIVLEESEYRHRAYSELSFDAIFEISPKGIITDCNMRACDLFGYTREELLRLNIKSLIPKEYRDTYPAILSEDVTTGNEAWERTYRRKDGTPLPTQVTTKVYSRGNEKRIIAYVRDISDHKEHELAMEKSLREKETLLAEIHHRVKNNLAIISGLLEMQSFNADNEKLAKELGESQSRIQSIAMVHEKLYQSESFSDIPIDTYIDDLVGFISDMLNRDLRHIRVEKNIESLSLDVTRAIPCGLILNELITNTFKHAFANRQDGLISITLKSVGDDILLSVKDNGAGLPADFQIDKSSSLGMTLIQTLVKQLDGSLSLHAEHGTRFEITFPKNR